MIRQEQFFKRYVVRRSSDLQTIKKVSSLDSLPTSSVLHTVDNFGIVGDITITPSLENRLMQLPPEKKHIHVDYHEPSERDLFHADISNIKFYKQGVRDALKTFRKSHADTVKFVSLDQLPDDTSRQAVINYNTIFNVRITGKFKTYKMFEFLMTEMLNNLVNLKDRNHIIHFDMPSQEFSRSDFQRAMKTMDWRKMAYPNSMNYLLMLHLLSFLQPDTELSFFDKLPDSVLRNTTIALTHNDKVVFYNLFTLREIGYDSTGIDLKIIAQHNRLVEEEEGETEADEYVSDDIVYTPSQYTEKLEDLVNEVEKDGEIPADRDHLKALKVLNTYIDDEKITEAVNSLVKGEKVKTNKQILKALRDALEERKKSSVKNTAGFRGVPETGETEAVEQQIEDLVERENKAIERIENNEQLTAAQKAKAKKAVKAYQDIKIPGPDGEEVTMQQLLQDPPVNEKEDDHLDFLEGEVRDPSLLDSTVDKMDDEYMRKQFHRDLARTIMSFDDMHPVDIQVNRTDNAVNRFDTYSVKFQDENLETHTVKFTLPLVDENGRCRLNGIEKAMKKQRLNNPICKVSPVRVTLTSNYNKTLVERNRTKAHSFYPRIAKILEKAEDMEVKHASCYPFDDGPYIDFPEDELESLQQQYDEGGRIFTIRVSDEYDKWSGDLESNHFESPMGTLQLLSRKTIKNLEDYEKYDEFRKKDPEGAKELQQYDKFLVMEFLPAPKPVTLPYEYTTLAKKIQRIDQDDLHLKFCYYSRFDGLKSSLIPTALQLEEQYGTFMGTILNTDTGCFISTDSRVYLLDMSNNVQLSTTYIIDILTEYAGVEHKPLDEWVSLKILNKSVPLGFALCYRFGLTYMLDYLGTEYEESEKGSRQVEKPKSSAVHLKFADRQIIIREPRYIDRVIFSGLNYYKLGDFYKEDLDQPDAYYDMIESQGMTIHYLKGIDSFFNLFVDPLTEDILRQMGEPTNFRDLLIRATVLLMSEDHDSSSSTSNTHIRTYNRLVAATYNELSREYSTYKTGSLGATNKFSINEEAVYRKIIGDQLMDNANTVNPLQVFRERSAISHMGEGGRSEETFQIPDRLFNDDNIGIVSEATNDDKKVAINADLTVNPNLKTLSGLGEGKSPDEVTPAELLSVTGAGMPAVTHDDGKRANYANLQAKHVVPTNGSDVFPVKTGFEKVMPHRCAPPFAFSATKNGKVDEIDEENQMVKITYEDGEKRAFHYGEEVSDNPGGGFSLTQRMDLNDIKEGQKFKKGDVLAYNPSFFKPDPFSSQAEMTMGVTATVAFVEDDSTLEDSSSISQELAERLHFKPVYTKDVIIPIDTTLHHYVKMGEEVSNTDPIMIFDEAEVPEGLSDKEDPELIEMLGELNKTTPRAEHDGVVKKIDAFYSDDLKEMDPSVAKTIRQINKVHNSKADKAADTEDYYKFPSQKALKKSTKVSNVQLDENVVVFKYYIEEDSGMKGGDKLIFSSSLKSVICEVRDDPITTEDGSITIDAKSSWRGVNNRLVTGVFLTGLAARVLEDLGEKAKEIVQD